MLRTVVMKEIEFIYPFVQGDIQGSSGLLDTSMGTIRLEGPRLPREHL